MFDKYSSYAGLAKYDSYDENDGGAVGMDDGVVLGDEVKEMSDPVPALGLQIRCGGRKDMAV